MSFDRLGDRCALYTGDCLEIMKKFPDNYVDSVITDPPYNLSFMGKKWDTVNNFQQWCQQWATESLRILKPGGHLAAFGGTRTYHRMVCGIEDAGFEIRDSLHWIQGSGFPKGKSQLKPSHEPIVLARKPFTGTLINNVLVNGTGSLNIDSCRTPAAQDYLDKCSSVVGLSSKRNGDTYGDWAGVRENSAHDAGRWPTNILLSHHPDCTESCQDGCAVMEMDRQSGYSTSTSSHRGERHGNIYGNGRGPEGPNTVRGHSDSGGSSRFFPVFRYQAKASSKERPKLSDGTAHPTVKPLALMQWLVKLVTPENGIILDPFAGSGSTLQAAVNENFRVIGIEREEQYVELCKIRMSTEKS